MAITADERRSILGSDNTGRCSALTLKLLYGFALPVGVVQEISVALTPEAHADIARARNGA